MLKNTKPDFPSTKRPSRVMLNGSKHAYPRLRRVAGFHRRHLSGTHPCVFRSVLQTPDPPQIYFPNLTAGLARFLLLI